MLPCGIYVYFCQPSWRPECFICSVNLLLRQVSFAGPRRQPHRPIGRCQDIKNVRPPPRPQPSTRPSQMNGGERRCPRTRSPVIGELAAARGASFAPTQTSVSQETFQPLTTQGFQFSNNQLSGILPKGTKYSRLVSKCILPRIFINE